ncbi:MAG TPA: Holliday junction resolvase RuvX [Firmicutes bacterium]|nr:Holliday junction resolvase RuvX [Bacillota bacterium]
MRILCIDVGEKRIGVAISDEEKIIARGLGTIERGKEEIKKIKEIIEKYNVEKIVFGLPLRLDGSISSQTEKTIAFISKLKEEISLPFIPWDERLSSRQAETILLEADLSRKKRKKLIDKLSAQIILQNYLDSMRRNISEEDEL